MYSELMELFRSSPSTTTTMAASSSPAPKRQRVSSMTEGQCRRVMEDFCKADVASEFWMAESSRILESLRAHPRLLQERFKLNVHHAADDNDNLEEEHHCLLDVIIRCGAGLDVIQELRELCPEPVDDLMKTPGVDPVQVKIANDRFMKLFTGFGPDVLDERTDEWSSSIEPDVLEYLVQEYPDICARKFARLYEKPTFLLEWILKQHDRSFVTAPVIKAVFEAFPDAVAKSEECLVGMLVQARCGKTAVIEAVVDAVIASKAAPITVNLCPRTKEELRKTDAKIMPKLFPHVQKLHVPLTFNREANNGTKDILKALAETRDNSIQELILEMPARNESSQSKIESMGQQLKNILGSEHTVVEKLVLRSRHLPSYYTDYPMDNWMVQLFNQAEKLPSTMKTLEFSNFEMDDTFDLSAWLQTPNLPATVAFSGLKIKGENMVAPSVERGSRPTLPSIKHLEFFAEGDRDCVRKMLGHAGTAAHLESLSLGFSQTVDVTETVRTLMSTNTFQSLELHANTLLDLAAFCEMLRGNGGLRNFHKLQYPKDSMVASLEDILENDNRTLSKVTMMGSGDQMEKVYYYTNLNRFGRREAHDPSIPLETLIGLLEDVAADKKLYRNSRVNTLYGLLRESIIGTWSVAAFDAAA